VGAFDDLASIQPLGIWDGVLARVVSGDRCTLAVVELDPGSVVKEHSHANEQLGIVLSGSVTFRVDTEVRDLGPGDTWRIPGNTPHEVHTGPEGAVVIDFFAPPRDDWKAHKTLDPQPPLWP
jgi:quercetin dioxygenase-like cupin family protein